MFSVRTLLIATALMPVSISAVAQSPAERAAALKEWRANCSDPDPDLRIAYIEAALETTDRTTIRTCLKPSLTSDNADTRNIALRAALASVERLTVEFSMPDAYHEAMEAAGSDTTKQNKIKGQFGYDTQALNYSNGQIGLVPKDVSLGAQNTRWYTIAAKSTTEDKFFGDFAVNGDTLSGSGRVQYGSGVDFNLNASLNDQGELVGTGKLYNSSELPVRIKLF